MVEFWLPAAAAALTIILPSAVLSGVLKLWLVALGGADGVDNGSMDDPEPLELIDIPVAGPDEEKERLFNPFTYTW